MGSGRTTAIVTAGNAEPQLGEARELQMKSDTPSWGLAFPGCPPAGNAEPQLGEARELRMKSDTPSWGLAFPGALTRSRTQRFTTRQ